MRGQLKTDFRHRRGVNFAPRGNLAMRCGVPDSFSRCPTLEDFDASISPAYLGCGAPKRTKRQNRGDPYWEGCPLEGAYAPSALSTVVGVDSCMSVGPRLDLTGLRSLPYC